MTPQQLYDIDFVKLIRWFTPGRLRKPRTLALLKAFVAPVVFVYQQFLTFRNTKLYELSITGQVCYLEALLNDRYDLTNRGIYIIDGLEEVPIYLYTDAEDHPLFLRTASEQSALILYTDGETGGDNGDDFIVMVPSSVIFNSSEMRSLINKYKLAGMRFKIQIF